MPTPEGSELGDRKILRRRVGMDLERFRGKNTNDDGAAIGRDEFQSLINIEHDGKKPISKDGLSALSVTAIGPVRGLFGTDDDEGVGLVEFWNAVAVALGLTGRAVLNSDQQPEGQILDATDEVSGSYGILQYLSGFYPSESGDDYWLTGWVRPPTGGSPVYPALFRAFPPLLQAGSVIPRAPELVAHVASLLGVGNVFTGVVQAATRVYLGGLSNATGIITIWTYDPATGALTLSENGATVYGAGLAPNPVMGRYNRDEVWYGNGLEVSGGGVRRRNRNTGAWSTPAYPGGVATFYVQQFAEAFSKLYIAGQRDLATTMTGAILSWDGAALAAARTMAVGTTWVVSVLYNPSDGYLYYLWGALNPAGTMYVGRYDGTTWTDAWFDLKGFSANGQYLQSQNALFLYRNEIHVKTIERLTTNEGFGVYRYSGGAWSRVFGSALTPIAGSPAFGMPILNY